MLLGKYLLPSSLHLCEDILQLLSDSRRQHRAPILMAWRHARIDVVKPLRV